MRLDGAGPVVLAGDSVTDCRSSEDPGGLGDGYARLVAQAHPGVRFVNSGRGGDLLVDLERRWATDVLAHRPAVVSVLIGINDTWRRHDEGRLSPVPEFEARYDRLLASATGAALVLVEPFVLPVDGEQRRWRADLDPRIAAVHRLARRHGAVLVPADRALNAAAQRLGAAALAADGVHPTPLGHRVLADLWTATLADT